jgi:hypothetical protein
MAEMMDQLRNMITDVIQQTVSSQISIMKGQVLEEIKNQYKNSRSATIPSSVGGSSESTATNSAISVQSNNVVKRRKTYHNPEYANRDAANIKTYLQKLIVPAGLTRINQYLQLVRDSNVRMLTYEEITIVNTLVTGFKNCRPKQGKGDKGRSDDPCRSEALAFAYCFDDVVFDPEYVFVIN